MKCTYQYATELSCFKSGYVSEFETERGYHGAAQEIAEHMDSNAAEYPDERIVWMKRGDDEPRKFIVYAENCRRYEAHERNDKI